MEDQQKEYEQLRDLLKSVRDAQEEVRQGEISPNKIKAEQLLVLFQNIEIELSNIKDTLEGIWSLAYKSNNSQLKEVTTEKLKIVADLSKRVRACRFNINFYML
jgi:hypothetical protein